MVAKSEKVSKTVLALPPFDVTAAVSAASQWRGIGLDQSKGHFKVWYLREYIGCRWVLEDAIALMAFTVQEREGCPCARESLWVCFLVPCKSLREQPTSLGHLCVCVFSNAVVTQVGVGDCPPRRGGHDDPVVAAPGPTASIGDNSGPADVEDFKFWVKVYSGMLPEHLNDMVCRRTGCGLSAHKELQPPKRM